MKNNPTFTMILRALTYYIFHRTPGRKADTRPSPHVDLSQYLGRWYELARYDTPFEEDMEEVFTDYKAGADGRIHITNCGLHNNHHRKVAHAIGYPSAPGQMKVSFIPLLRFLTTPYNILAVDEFYRNALVSNSDGSCLWFLSRTPQINPDTFDSMKREALRRGFDLSALHFTKHRYNS